MSISSFGLASSFNCSIRRPRVGREIVGMMKLSEGNDEFDPAPGDGDGVPEGFVRWVEQDRKFEFLSGFRDEIADIVTLDEAPKFGFGFGVVKGGFRIGIKGCVRPDHLDYLEVRPFAVQRAFGHFRATPWP